MSWPTPPARSDVSRFARQPTNPIVEPAAGPAFRRLLLAWYARNARPLPWRRDHAPYRVWLSEIMLQQTRVDTVIPYFERFLVAFPTVDDLAAAPLDRVLKLWEGLGYYSRARNLHRAARELAGPRRGRFPRTASELAQLPGVGRYTAAAIASIAFGEPAAALDGNIKRVLARVYLVQTPLTDTSTAARLWLLADQCLARRRPGDWNQALMELGATLCTPRRPRCGECPLRRHCAAFAGGVQEQVPVRIRRGAVPHRELAAAVVEHRGRLLLTRRPERGLLGGLWEFPKVELPNGEPHAAALRLMLRRDWGVTIAIGPPLTPIRHAFTHFTLQVHARRCTARSRRLLLSDGRIARWVTAAQIRGLALPRVDQKIVSELAARSGVFRAKAGRRLKRRPHRHPSGDPSSAPST